MYHEGDQTHFNQELKDYHVPILVNQLKKESDYDKRRTEGTFTFEVHDLQPSTKSGV